MNDATVSRSSAASGARVGSGPPTAAGAGGGGRLAARDGREPGLPLETVRAGERARVDDTALRDPEPLARPLLLARDDDADAHAAQPLHAHALLRDVLERLEPVAQPGGVLEAQVVREPLQLGPQLRHGVLDRLPLDALEGARRELRAASAPQRAELARQRRADDSVAAPAEVDVAVRTCGARVRRGP